MLQLLLSVVVVDVVVVVGDTVVREHAKIHRLQVQGNSRNLEKKEDFGGF